MKHIHAVVLGLTPEGAGTGSPINALPQSGILATLEANWVNGVDLASQKAIAKSLIKLHLSVGNAAAVAIKASVDPADAGCGGRQHRHRNGSLQPQGDAYPALT